MTITGQTAIVTGAANGVGLAIAARFAEAGARVVLMDLDEEHLTDATAKLTNDGLDAIAVAGDVRERLTIANLISATIDAFDRIDILVNASRQVSYGDPLEMAPDELTELFDQNVGANLRLTQAVVKRLLKQREDAEDTTPAGAIVNVSSIAAARTRPELAGYSISCAALDQLTKSMAVSLARHRIRVNAVAIGSVMSASLRGAFQENEALRDQMVAATPIGRIGQPDEAAEAALFLASERANFVTGQILAVDGGRTLLDPMEMPAY